MNQSDNSIPDVNKPGTTRRQFIQAGALATAGFFIVPRHVLGGKGFIAPSDKLNIAGVGFGGKGFSDTNNSYNNGANNIVALCDVDWGLPKVKEKLREASERQTLQGFPGRCLIRKAKPSMP